LGCFGTIAAVVCAGPALGHPATFPEFSRSTFEFFSGKHASFGDYEKIDGIFGGLSLTDKQAAGQLISQIDAVYGRYDEAAKHLEMTFPNLGGAGDRLRCPKGAMQVTPALPAVGRIARDARFFLINESHSLIETRAFIYQILPILHDQGYRYLAMEALAPSHVKVFESSDSGLESRGYPIDTAQAGFYLREPVYAEIVRSAKQLGYHLIAYESDKDKKWADREEIQAENLALFIQKHPQEKVIVLAGYTHIWKRGGWMADRLQRKRVGKIVSVDQLAGLGGCEGRKGPASEQAYVLTAHGELWSSQPDRVDITVLRSGVHSEPSSAAWLTLGKARRPVQVPLSWCEAFPCLVSAYYLNESDLAVPADRLAIMDMRKHRSLYLRPGDYRIVIEDSLGARSRLLKKLP
jgi:hypothetical protein